MIGWINSPMPELQKWFNLSAVEVRASVSSYIPHWTAGVIILPYPNMLMKRAPNDLAHSGPLTHWGRVTHIWVIKLTIIVSDNGLAPGWRQAIIWINAEMFLIGSMGTNFSKIFIEIYSLSFKKMHLKMPSGEWRPFCLSFNVLMQCFGVFLRCGLNKQLWGLQTLFVLIKHTCRTIGSNVVNM